MKVRLGHVSNSSSSSFIVISHNTPKETHIPKFDEISIPYRGGCYQFGWDWEKHQTFGSRLNFAAIQANIKAARDAYNEKGECRYNEHYMERLKPSDEWLVMLKDVLREEFGDIDITLSITDDCYIDHQSNVGDGQNYEMFNSREDLKAFLFNEGSYIKTGNDNEEAPQGWYDE